MSLMIWKRYTGDSANDLNDAMDHVRAPLRYRIIPTKQVFKFVYAQVSRGADHG